MVTCYPDEIKETTIQFAEPVTKVCIERTNHDGARKDKSFIVGCTSGKLLLHRTAWFNQKKDITLFNGTGSAVTNIVWRGDLVAWSDAGAVRVMDISNQTGICHLNPPTGISAEDPFPCCIYWESEDNLIVGWADYFYDIKIITSRSLLDDEGFPKSAVIIATWTTDNIICGLFPFDANHVIFLGYSPPDEVDYEQVGSSTDGADVSTEQVECNSTNIPEIIIAKRSTGEIVSADCLAMKGINMSGPFGYTFMSSYQCGDHTGHYSLLETTATPLHASRLWDMNVNSRGGDKGYAPLSFIVSSSDFVVARVRDVNDRVGYALEQCDLRKAAELAVADRNSLRQYQYSDILHLYVHDLLERHKFDLAAEECCRLIGQDLMLWETWVYKFMEYKQLHVLSIRLPVASPRLPKYIYEEVIRNHFYDNTAAFYEVVKKWSKISPPLFSHEDLIASLENLPNKYIDAYYLEALAQLYTSAHSYEKALNCYLDIPHNIVRKEAKFLMKDRNEQDEKEYRHVFDLIEKQNLFKTIEKKIVNLVRLSQPLAAKLLLENLEKLPIASIADQLSVDKRLLFWYLDLVFNNDVACEIYSNKLEYGQLHAIQVELYADLPIDTKSSCGIVSTELSDNLEVIDINNDVLLYDKSSWSKTVVDSPLMKFLKSGLAPFDVALGMCEIHNPPLFREMIYILSQLGNSRKALYLLLAEIGDLAQAIKFIEEQIAKALNASENSPVTGGRSNLVNKPEQLWNDLIEYCLQNHGYLIRLVDYLGICSLDPVVLLRRIPKDLKIPGLQKKIMLATSRLNFQSFKLKKCNKFLEVDSLSLLRQQNQGQRKAMKVSTLNLIPC